MTLTIPKTRFKLTLAYNGKTLHGFQTQSNADSVQSQLENALKKILGETIRVTCAGRTDAGVHALAQLVHFDVTTKKASDRIKHSDLVYKLNCVLPLSIVVIDCKKVAASFHARKMRSQKHYVYWILISQKRNPFIEDYVWRIPKPLDEAAMKRGSKHLIGKHDFTSFCASDSTDPNKTKEIFSISFSHKKLAPFLSFKHEKYLRIDVRGSGFLKQMVRNIVGTLVAVGQKKIVPAEIKTILAAKNRIEAYQTAPAKGLIQAGLSTTAFPTRPSRLAISG